MAVRTIESNVKTQSEVIVHRARAQEATLAQDQTREMMSLEEVKASIEARVKAALDEAMLSTREEIAEPEDWWNLYALGPIQVTSVPAPLFPHQVIKMGETGYVATVLFLNPFLTISPNS